MPLFRRCHYVYISPLFCLRFLISAFFFATVAWLISAYELFAAIVIAAIDIAISRDCIFHISAATTPNISDYFRLPFAHFRLIRLIFSR